MAQRETFEPGGYAYVPGVFQYSCGAVALPGYEVVRVTFAKPVPVAEGFARIEGYLTALGRPLTSFCGCELRSPAPFTEAGFKAFNEIYVGTLGRWGIYRDGVNPVARSNVCPKIDPPAEPSFYAFCHTIPSTDARPSCVVAGSGEVPEGRPTYRDHIVALGDVSHDGMRAKAEYVTGEMRRRLGGLGFAAADVTATQVYTVEPIHRLIESTLLPSGLGGPGLTWHYCRPPIEGLDFEMDCRVVRQERVI